MQIEGGKILKFNYTRMFFRLIMTCSLLLPNISLSQENSYLCISKRFAVIGRPVSSTDIQQFYSYGRESEQSFIINRDGLSLFGWQTPILDFCYHHESGNVTCEARSGFGGWFNKTPSNLFTLVRLSSNHDFTSTGATT